MPVPPSFGFLTGTLIATRDGEKPVETLTTGEFVVTRAGYRRVLGLTETRLPGGTVEWRQGPLRVAADTLEDGAPGRDLLVAPGQALLIGATLVDAGLLENGVSVTPEPLTPTLRATDIVFQQIELASPDCVLAEGIWAESRRGAPDIAGRIADPADPDLDAIKASLATRFAARVAPTPGLHLLADGVRIDPDRAEDYLWEFTLPGGTQTLVLASNASIPAAMGLSPDVRRLGICVNRLQVNDDEPVALDRQGFGNGFYNVEGTAPNFQRWTNGEAHLPVGLIGAPESDVRLTIGAGKLPWPRRSALPDKRRNPRHRGEPGPRQRLARIMIRAMNSAQHPAAIHPGIARAGNIRRQTIAHRENTTLRHPGHRQHRLVDFPIRLAERAHIAAHLGITLRQRPGAENPQIAAHHNHIRIGAQHLQPACHAGRERRLEFGNIGRIAVIVRPGIDHAIGGLGRRHQLDIQPLEQVEITLRPKMENLVPERPIPGLRPIPQHHMCRLA